MWVSIGRIVPLSPTAFPNHTSMVVYFGGCNWRCPYCNVPGIVRCRQCRDMTVSKVFEEMIHCGDFIDAVVFTGGEPTLQPEPLFSLCQMAKQENLLVRLHTNGSKPGVIDKLLDRRVVDSFAVDFKASKANYGKAAGVDEPAFESVMETIKAVKKSRTSLEVIIPVIKGLNASLVPAMTGGLKGCTVVLTEFEEGETLDSKFKGKSVSRDGLHEIGRKCSGKVFVRSKTYGLEPV